jgi:hypothetical protein
VELIRRFTPEQYAGALEAWAFLGLEGKHPEFSSPFGDVFLQAEDGWWFLDVVAGKLTREWASTADLEAALNSADGQEQFLMSGLAAVAEQLGLTPAESQVLAFTVPPSLGGPVDPSNLEVSDMEVTVNVYGQIQEQTRDLPPGTQISGFTIGDGPAG